MASTLSEEEFHRIQENLLELRTTNYNLEECCRKQQSDINTLTDRCQYLDREYQKAQKALLKSKKARDVELLIQDNEKLQIKLHSQEEEFQLQNSTMMQELSILVSTNEKLEKDLKNIRENSSPKSGLKSSQEVESLENELRKLQAENTILQKNLATVKLNYDDEILRLRSSLTEMSELCNQHESSSPMHDTSCWSLEGSSPEDSDIIEVGSKEVSYHKSPNGSVIDVIRQAEERVATLEKELKEFHELRVKYETVEEEKKLLKKELSKAQSFSENESISLQEDLERLTEKLKKKQESIVQLQEEKEALYAEKTKSCESLQAIKDQEIQQLKDQNQRLQTQLNNISQNFMVYKDKMSERAQTLEKQLTLKETEVNEQSAEKLLELQAENDTFKSHLTEAGEEIENLSKQFQDATNLNESLVTRANSLEEEVADLSKSLDEIKKIADKRKCLMDEMAINMQKKAEQHKEELSQLNKDYADKLKDLNEKLEEERLKSNEVDELRVQVEDFETQVQSLACTKGWFERRLNETEESLEKTKKHYESLLTQTKAESDMIISKTEEDCTQKIQDLKNQLETYKIEKSENDKTINKLIQDSKDSVEDRKIHEKKGASIVKDLKRQLQMERKRAEKLQERLEEALNDSTQTRSVEANAFKPPEDKTDRADTSSISSWSLMSGQLDKENGVRSPTPAKILEQENNDLVMRVTAIQEEKWILEEKVNHLEESNSAMADDIMRKQAIIQYYCMEGRADRSSHALSGDKLTVKRVVDFIKDKGDENQREINRKLLRTLEETLTKNMCLQKDLEILSQQLERLGDDENIGISCVDLTSSITTDDMFTSVEDVDLVGES